MEKKRKIYFFVFIILTTLILVPFVEYFYDFESSSSEIIEDIHSSAERTVTKQWIKNPTFESPIDPPWYWENGTEGDNSDMEATSSPGQANYEVLGETLTFTVVSGTINNSVNSQGWKQFNKEGFLLPDTAMITTDGCYVSHEWTDDPNQFPSAHWKTNISLPIDMTDYVIVSAFLEVIVNASVSSNIDTPNDGAYWENFAIGDSVTFYSQISDLGYNPPRYTVALNKTKYLGQNSPSILTISDSPLTTVNEIDLITALNSAFEKDPDHSNFTLTLGIDIYSEDNYGGTDTDTFSDLFIKTCNLTFTVKKKIDQSTTLSWNQIGNKISGGTIQIIDANFNFEYKINNPWPAAAPLSEIKFTINNKKHEEGTLKLSSTPTSFQEAKVGGFNVTKLISTDINITVSIEVFLKDTFELDQVYTISIDNVYLNISYIETFSDYGTDLQLFLNNENKTSNPIIQIPIFNTLNITVTYTDNQTGNHIDAATVQLEGKVSGSLTEDAGLEQYYILVDTTQLGIGVNVLTVNAQKMNYEAKLVQIFVEVFERPTEIVLLADNIERSSNETIDVKFDEFLNITVYYRDNITKGYINGASVNLLGIGNFTEIGNQYNYTLNTNDLNQGINILTIFAHLNNYQSQTFQFFINVFERTTELLLYVDSIQKFDSDTINSQYDEFINITIFYRDDLTKSHLSSASIELLGIGSLDEISNQYNFTLNSNDLNQGMNVLTIFAQLNNYQSQTIQFFINIQERATRLQLYIDGIQKNATDTIDTQFDEYINITVLYHDDFTKIHLSGASVELIGVANLSETGNQYNLSINTNILEKGINILTIFAQLDGYQPKTIQFFINVNERATELILLVDGVPKNHSDTIQVERDEYINITTLYRDEITFIHLSGAHVELLGVANFSEIADQYNITINSNNLEHGINILTIFAQLTNYQPKSIQLFVEVVERATQLLLYLNGNETTIDPVLELPIGSFVNITLCYLDNKTTLNINGAALQLIGEGLTENLTENLMFSHYSIILDTSNLGIGVKLFTIIAQATNYRIITIDIRITVRRINTLINTTSGGNYIDIKPGENFPIKVVLNNTDFGGTIKNATVTYRWAHGQGQLQDPDNDGIYEALLQNVPAGSYIITISAFAGENYEFEDFEIILNAIAEPGLNITIIIILLAAGVAGLSTFFIIYQKHFKYPPKVRKIRKLRKKISKNKKLKPITLQTRQNIINENIINSRQILDADKLDFDDLRLKNTKKEGGNTSE